MPARSSVVLKLPRETRARLDALLIEHGFGGYAELVAWLEAEGHAISKDAIGRYSRSLREALEPELNRIRISTEEARLLNEELRADDGDMVKTEAALALAQERIYGALRRMGDDAPLGDVGEAARAVTRVSTARVSVSREKRAALREAAERAGAEAKKRGVTPEGIAAIRAAVEGSPE